MFKLFNPTSAPYVLPLSERKYLLDASLNIEKIIDRSKLVTFKHLNNSHRLIQLIKKLENEYIFNDVDEYYRLVTARAEVSGPILGYVTETMASNIKDMGLTSPDIFDIVLLHDDFSSDPAAPALRCLFHPFTALDYRIPDGNWVGTPVEKYSIWSINVYSLMYQWREAKIAALSNQLEPNLMHFAFGVLTQCIPEILDHSLLNRVERNNEFEPLDVETSSQWPFFVKQELNKVRMSPKENFSHRAILNSVPSVNPLGMTDTMRLPRTPLRKHLILLYSMARLPVMKRIKTLNRNEWVGSGENEIRYFKERFIRWSFNRNSAIAPATILNGFIKRLIKII